MSADPARGALDAIDRLLNRGGDADEVLRAVVSVLHERLPHLRGVWLEFCERGERVAGPAAGASGAMPAETFPVRFGGTEVAVVAVAAAPPPNDYEVLERVATLISPYCLVGWDTGGEAWQP